MNGSVKKNSGFFVTLEGGEGSGKTTVLSCIDRWLAKKNIACVHTREPGGTPFAERIRELLLHTHEESLASMTELLLMFAARAQNIDQVIRPALAEGKLVLSDRFTDASFAYQGAGRGLDIGALKTLEALVQGELQPDLTLLLDLPVADGMARASARGELDRIEREQHDFFERVREGYLSRAKEYPERFVIIDASRSIAEVEAQIINVLEARIAHG